MTQFLYRFRAIKYLLDDKYQELNNQEIYFASPDYEEDTRLET